VCTVSLELSKHSSGHKRSGGADDAAADIYDSNADDAAYGGDEI